MRQANRFLTIVLTAVVLAGCGSASYNNSQITPTSAAYAESQSNAGWGADYAVVEDADEASYESYAADTENYVGTDESGTNVPDEPGMDALDKRVNRKLIKTVNVDVETKDFDTLLSTVEQQVEVLGGYIESMDSYNGSIYYGYRSSRSANLQVRIPQQKLGSFLDQVSQIGNVTNRSEYVEDVTLTYVDIQSKRDTLEAEHGRLLELMEQAQDIEDIIKIEERLSNVRYQLESMEAQLRTYDNKVDYSTVSLHISEVQELTPVEEESTWERISGGFVSSLYDIGDGLKEFVVWFLVHIPYLVLWAIVVVITGLVARKIVRRKKGKKNLKETEEKNTEKTDE